MGLQARSRSEGKRVLTPYLFSSGMMDNKPETITQSIDSQPDFSEPEKNVYADVYRVLLWGMIVSTILFMAGIVIALMHPQYIPLK